MKIHFIGIGGIGMSALAWYFLARGDKVSGSDAVESEIIQGLRLAGAEISTPELSRSSPLFEKERGQEINLVIYSAAVPEGDPELVEARRLDIKTQKYAQALGELTRAKYTIAVSGMHGKSTTTAMIGLVMEKAGLDPTVILGTRVREWGNSNCRVGKNNYLVIEADEYDRSFLNYWPKILVLLNVEEEHLDTYAGGLPDIMETFAEYVGHLPEDGILIANGEDKNIAAIISPKSEFQISEQIQKQKFKIKKYNSESADGLNLKISGRYNLSNANAALVVAEVLGIDEKIAVEALNNFAGTWRRMEYKGKLNGARIYDDYGHHPTEIKTTLEGTRELLTAKHPALGGERLWCVFQPHQYRRTHDLFDKFVGAFGAADKVILLPIYSVAGREDEEIKKKVSAEKLCEALNSERRASGKDKAIFSAGFNEAADYLRENLKKGDVCVIMGAGDIYQLSEKIV